MTDKKMDISASESDHDPNMDFPVPVDRRGIVDRFRAAIRHAGGTQTVAERSGVPKGTINNLLRGTEIRFAAACAVATTCDVRIDWIWTGKAEFWPDWYRKMMTGSIFSRDKDGPGGRLKPEFEYLVRPDDADEGPESAVREPEAAPLSIPLPIDPARLKQAMELIVALDGVPALVAEGGAERIARAYDVLTGAKP